VPDSKKAITEAFKQGSIHYLVCTDAASEGLNLQFGSGLINYDLPWNPSKIEQRIGRIDRIGQTEKEIKIYNFFLRNSIDEKVYGALRRRCGLFEHFVGTMQPVLTRAQRMLNRPKDFSVEELERIATEAEKNYLNSAAYLDSEAVVIESAPPAVRREDFIAAVDMLQPECGLQVSKKDVRGGITIKGLTGKSPRFGISEEILDADPGARPLTALSPEATEIADHLSRAGENLPLIIESHRFGAFRRSFAIWVTSAGVEPILTLQELKTRIQAWDGTLPAPEKITPARHHAQQHARAQVEEMASRAAKIEEENLASQKGAASLRLTREIGRLLRCLDPTVADLSQLLESQATRVGPLAERIRKAIELLGGKVVWTDHIRWELDEFVKNLTPNETKSRLSGSSIDAAFADYRWNASDSRGLIFPESD
jgi:hypothetical protein